jgi:hypothetical protein
MFALAILFAVLSVVVYLCTSRMRLGPRTLLAASIFVLGTLGTWVTLMSIVDRPPPCSRTVNPETVYLGPPEPENCDRHAQRPFGAES